MTAQERFEQAVQAAIFDFPENRLCRAVASSTLTMAHYHTLLTTLFHQTREGPYTFALASAHCDWRFEEIKEYLARHAEEECTHWRWVVDDLASTGYAGPDPRTQVAHPATMVYLAMNRSSAISFAPARLAIAAVLEGIGATHGLTYGGKLLKALRLSEKQASFLLSHGSTDVGHSEELMAVLSRATMSDHEWEVMTRTAEIAGRLYRDMYDHAGYESAGD